MTDMPSDADEKDLGKFVDMIEQNEKRIHNGIASGRFDKEEDKQDEEDEQTAEEDNYGKSLLQDMANFRQVKIPGVDFDLEPVPVPVEILEINEIDQEARPQEEGPPQDEGPPPEYGPPPSEHSPESGPPQSNFESGESPPDDYLSEKPPLMNPRGYSHESLPPNEEIDSDPIIDHHHHHHNHFHHDHQNKPQHESEPQNPINTFKQKTKSEENISEDNDTNENEFGDRARDPLPPMTHSSYQDSANLMNNRQNVGPNDGHNDGHSNGHNDDDQHAGTLPHSHPIDENEENEKENKRRYYEHNEHNSPESHRHEDSDHLNPNEDPTHLHPPEHHNEDPNHSHPSEDPTHLHPPEDPNHYHEIDDSVSDPNDHNRRQPANDESPHPIPYNIPDNNYYPNIQKDIPIVETENPVYSPIEYNPLPLPFLSPVDPNVDPEHKHDDDPQPNQENGPPKPPEVGGRGDLIMKYYEDQSKVDSQRYTNLAKSEPNHNKTGLKLVKRENSKRFENYKNTNSPQVIDENKRFNKRMSLSSNPESEPKGHYYPIDYDQPPEPNIPGTTKGSREYRKSQEYHSYEPNTQMSDEELPSDELKKFYDQWADQQLQFNNDKFKKDDHLHHGSPLDYSHHNTRTDRNKGKVYSSDKSQPLSAKDYESSRPRNPGHHHSHDHSHHNHHHRTHPPKTLHKSHNEPHERNHHHHDNHDEQPKHHRHEPHEEIETDSHTEEEHEDDDHPEHETHAEETPHHNRYPPNRSNPSKTYENQRDDEDDYHSHSNGPNGEHHNQQNRENNYRKEEKEGSGQKPDDNFEFDLLEKQTSGKLGTFSLMPFNFESLIASDTSFLDALTPQNMSGIGDNYQDYDNPNGQEINENENPEQSRSEDESHQSPPRDTEDDQQEYEENRERQRSPQHKQHKHSQYSQLSHRSDPPQSYKSDKNSKEYNNKQNKDYPSNQPSNGDYYRQNTNSRYERPNDRSNPNQPSNDGYYNKNHNERQQNQYSQQYEDKPRIRPYSGRGQQYYDEEKAATADTSSQKADPNTGILLSDESKKVLAESNSSIDSNNDNQTLTIKSIDSFSSWTKPLILKTKLITVDNRNETKVLENTNNESNNSNKGEDQRVKQRTVESKRKNSRNITRKPKVETQITLERNDINSVNISNKNQTYDMIISPNNKSEYQLKPSNPQTINQQLVRTIRTRPQRSISENIINFERNSYHLNHNQLSGNSPNSWAKVLPNIWTHLRNRSSESSITQPNCAQRSSIKNFCLELDDEYPLESIRRNLIRNLENLRSVHRKLNSSVTNDRYYEDSTDSLDNSCKAQRLTVRPLRAKNINGEWKVVVNIAALFEQRITLTNCSEEHNECETNGQKYFTKCVQKYSLNDLITYNTESSDFEIDILLVPNACSCSAPKTNII